MQQATPPGVRFPDLEPSPLGTARVTYKPRRAGGGAGRSTLAGPDLEAARPVRKPDARSPAEAWGSSMIDDAGLHSALAAPGDRLKHVSVDEDMNVSLVEPLGASKPPDKEDVKTATACRRSSRWPPPRSAWRDQSYIGLAPGATYFVVPYGGRDERRLDRAIEWVVENRRAMEHPHHPDRRLGIPLPADPRLDGLIKNTGNTPSSAPLAGAVRAGILVVAGNGNTAAGTSARRPNTSPSGPITIPGLPIPKFHRENPDEPWGRNTDGHLRPRTSWPRGTHVPNHQTPEGEIGYFGRGDQFGSAQVAGLCALLFARFPERTPRRSDMP